MQKILHGRFEEFKEIKIKFHYFFHRTGPELKNIVCSYQCIQKQFRYI